MKIVHVVCTTAFAGVERHVAVLAAAEAQRGHEVVVVGGHRERMRSAIGDGSIRLIPGRSVLGTAAVLARHGDADVFNVHMTDAEVAAAIAWPSRRVPVVSTRHFAAPRGQSSRLAGIVSRWAARRISRQIAVSRYVADHIEPPSTVIISGVASTDEGVDGQSSTRESVVLVVQRLEAEKRTADALHIFAQSGLAGAGWRMVIVGEGKERSRLEALASELGLGVSLAFLGYRSDVDQLMLSASVLLAPIDTEALGLTVLEAMSLGLVVVAAGGGGHVETVGSVAPELCYAPGDLAAAAAILRCLASSEADCRVIGVRLRDAQRRRFTVEAQAAATEAVYRRAANGR